MSAPSNYPKKQIEQYMRDFAGLPEDEQKRIRHAYVQGYYEAVNCFVSMRELRDLRNELHALKAKQRIADNNHVT